MSYRFQRAFSIVLVIVLTPLMLCIGLLVRLVDGKPVLFQQARAGQAAQVFKLYKFRTMKNDADSLLVDGADPKDRLTRTGPLLRKSGLDELPQLFNVANGDMALIGPRAMLPEIADRLPERFLTRFEVLPGITGLAQVSGRNTVVWSRRLALDVEYVSSRSTRNDLCIAARTVKVLALGSGHSPDRNTSSVDDLGLLEKDYA